MLQGFKQSFQGKDFVSRRATITANAGTLPTDTAAFLFVHENGQKLYEGGGYFVSGSDLVLTFDPISLANYEVIFWTEAATVLAESADCFSYIFGLSQTECNCFEPKPTDFNRSDSGIFLDQLAPLSKISGLDNCEATDVWNAMVDARREAVMYLKADAKALIANRYEYRRKTWKGTIGQAVARTELTTNKSYTGGVIGCAPIRSGNLKITGIGTIYSATGTVTLQAFNNANEQVAELELQTQAGKHKLNAVELDLPLLIPYTNETRYYFVVQYDAANKPLVNKTDCGCGGWSSRWSWGYPYYYEPKRRNSNGWSNWVMVGGAQVDNLTDFDLENSINNEFYGLTFQVELACDANQSLCNETLDFQRDEYAMTLAFAARYKAAAILLQRLMLSDAINRQALLSREEMEANRREYEAKYMNALEYVAQNVNLNNSDCFKCRSRMSMQGITT